MQEDREEQLEHRKQELRAKLEAKLELEHDHDDHADCDDRDRVAEHGARPSARSPPRRPPAPTTGDGAPGYTEARAAPWAMPHDSGGTVGRPATSQRASVLTRPGLFGMRMLPLR